MEHLAVAQLPGAGGLSSAAFAPNPMVASSMAALSGSALVADELARDELRGGEKPGSDPADDDDDDDDDDDEDDGVGGKRKHGAEGEGGSKKKRLQRAHTGDKNNKGLRHFSMKVCNKVEEKTRTTYNEVADELVTEFVPSDGISPLDQAYDEKNIRRRVYDALNVLMAMDIIAKEKKNITWRGLPTNARQEADRLQADADERCARVESKRLQLQELLTQQISFKHLLARNRVNPTATPEHSRVHLPFIIVNTSKQTVIDCEMAEDKHDIFFNFSMPFEIHDDNEILKRMGMHNCHLADLPHLVPPALICYTPQFQLAQWRVESRGGGSSAFPGSSEVERYHGSLGGDEMGANGDAAGVKTED